MHPLKTSAQFAAFLWFTRQTPAKSTAASQFANEHWQEFLPAAHEGIGLLLMKIAEPEKRRAARPSAKRRAFAKAS